jgi:hypothetical protein
MRPRLFLAAAVLTLAAHLQLQAQHPASYGCSVEIDSFSYSYVLGGQSWSMECRYRLDGGEWRQASSDGKGGTRLLQIPGTTVRVEDPGDRTLDWTYGDDVQSLRID